MPRPVGAAASVNDIDYFRFNVEIGKQPLQKRQEKQKRKVSYGAVFGFVDEQLILPERQDGYC